jgi:hypothetical protein
MIDGCECGVTGGKRIGKGTKVLKRKHCPLQIADDLVLESNKLRTKSLSFGTATWTTNNTRALRACLNVKCRSTIRKVRDTKVENINENERVCKLMLIQTYFFLLLVSVCGAPLHSLSAHSKDYPISFGW